MEVVRAGARIRVATFIDVDIFHRIASLRTLYSVTLTEIFKVNIFVNLKISEKIRASIKKGVLTFIEVDIFDTGCHHFASVKLRDIDLDLRW